MTKQKSTKRALLMSALSLLLCVSMLVGTTFAWFTDEVKSGTNVIAAGNLDVELTHADKGTNGEFKPVDGNTLLFDDVDLWEPGAVAYEKLTVANVGDLALKYNLAINVANANGVKVDGMVYTLADVLKVAVVDAEKLTSREAAIVAGKDKWKPLASWSENGKLYAEGDTTGASADTYGIVIYWEPTDNDNIWNMNNGKTTTDGGKQLTIDLGVHLVATQLTYEKDSYGDQYDANAYMVGSDEDFKAAVNSDDENIIIELTGNVTYIVKDNDSTFAMGGASTKTITINGNGYAITFNGLSDNNNYITTNGAKLVINDAEIAATSTGTAIKWNVQDILFGCAVELNNVTSNQPIALKAGATLNNVTISDSSDVYALWIQATKQTVTIDGLTVNAGRGIKIAEEYVNAPAKVTLNVSNATFNTAKKAAIMVESAAGAVIALDKVDIANTVDTTNAVWVDADAADTLVLVKVTGGNVIVEPTPTTITATDLYDALLTDAADGEINIDKDYVVTGDWTSLDIPVDVYNVIAEKIVVNGNGHTISGLTTSLLDGSIAGKVTINDLTIKDSTIAPTNTNELGNGAFIAYRTNTGGGSLTMTNCHAINVTVNSNENAGALVGYCSGDAVAFTDCTVTNCTINGDNSVGGIVGHIQSNGTFTNCKVTNTKLASTKDGDWRVGAIIGTANGENTTKTLTNCTESGNTLSQTEQTAPGHNLYGRIVDATLKIDGVAVQ